MQDVNEFYEVANNRTEPSGLLKGFFNMNIDKTLKEKVAIELGTGVGTDTKFLLEKGFKVTCIDKEEKAKELTLNKIKNKEILKFIVDRFENVKLHKADLIYSCFSLQFCDPNKIDDVMEKITNNINKEGYFVRQFLRRK